MCLWLRIKTAICCLCMRVFAYSSGWAHVLTSCARYFRATLCVFYTCRHTNICTHTFTPTHVQVLFDKLKDEWQMQRQRLKEQISVLNEDREDLKVPCVYVYSDTHACVCERACEIV